MSNTSPLTINEGSLNYRNSVLAWAAQGLSDHEIWRKLYGTGDPRRDLITTDPLAKQMQLEKIRRAIQPVEKPTVENDPKEVHTIYKTNGQRQYDE